MGLFDMFQGNGGLQGFNPNGYGPPPGLLPQQKQPQPFGAQPMPEQAPSPYAPPMTPQMQPPPQQPFPPSISGASGTIASQPSIQQQQQLPQNSAGLYAGLGSIQNPQPQQNLTMPAYEQPRSIYSAQGKF